VEQQQKEEREMSLLRLLNEGSPEELRDLFVKLPFVGTQQAEKWADGVVDFRETEGPFQDTQQLTNLEKMGPKRVQSLEELVTELPEEEQVKEKSRSSWPWMLAGAIVLLLLAVWGISRIQPQVIEVEKEVILTETVEVEKVVEVIVTPTLVPIVEEADEVEPETALPLRVSVVGAVAEPGVYSLDQDSRIIDLITAAGGLLPEADQESVNLAAMVTDGEQVVIPVMPEVAIADADVDTDEVMAEVVTSTVASLAFTDTNSVSGSLYAILGAPKAVTAPSIDSSYKNTIGFNTHRWVAEPGVLTADSIQDCAGNASCWHISPDRQYVLTDRVGEGTSVREDAWTLVSGARGMFELGSVKIQLDARDDHVWMVLVRGLNPGPGDRNVPMWASDFDPGFTLVTHLPVGARVSENYFLENVQTGLSRGNCGRDGCTHVSALLFDVNNGAWVIITRSRTTSWSLVATNLVVD
jgi:DNA uptake protein ComE-like DNA-binding protein